MIYSNASRHLTEALLLPAAMLVMSHRRSVDANSKH